MARLSGAPTVSGAANRRLRGGGRVPVGRGGGRGDAIGRCGGDGCGGAGGLATSPVRRRRGRREGGRGEGAGIKLAAF